MTSQLRGTLASILVLMSACCGCSPEAASHKRATPSIEGAERQSEGDSLEQATIPTPTTTSVLTESGDIAGQRVLPAESAPIRLLNDASTDAVLESDPGKGQSPSIAPASSMIPPSVASSRQPPSGPNAAEQLPALMKLKSQLADTARELRRVNHQLERLDAPEYVGGPFYGLPTPRRNPGRTSTRAPKWILQWGLESARTRQLARAANLAEEREVTLNTDLRERLTLQREYQQELHSLQQRREQLTDSRRYARREQLKKFSSNARRTGASPHQILKRIAQIGDLQIDPDEWLLGWEGRELLAGSAPAGGIAFGEDVDVYEIPLLLPDLYEARTTEKIVRDRMMHLQSMLQLIEQDSQNNYAWQQRYRRRVADNQIALRRIEHQLADAIESRQTIADLVARPGWEDQLTIDSRQQKRDLTVERDELRKTATILQSRVNQCDFKAINTHVATTTKKMDTLSNGWIVVATRFGLDIVDPTDDKLAVRCEITVFDASSPRFDTDGDDSDLYRRAATLRLQDRFPIMRDDRDRLVVYAGDVEVSIQSEVTARTTGIDLCELLCSLVDLGKLEQLSPIELPEIRNGGKNVSTE